MRMTPQSLHEVSKPGIDGRRVYSPQRLHVAPARVIDCVLSRLLITIPEEKMKHLSNGPNKHQEEEEDENEEPVSDRDEVQANLSTCPQTEHVKAAVSMATVRVSTFFWYSVIFKEPETPHSGHFMSGPGTNAVMIIPLLRLQESEPSGRLHSSTG
jgi:hypothetical protein